MKRLSLFLLISFPIFLLSQQPELIPPIGHTKAVNAVAMSSDGNFVLTGSADQAFNLWNRKGHLIRRSEAHKGPIMSVAFHPGSQYFVTASSDRTAKLWDLEGNLLQTFEPDAGVIYDVVFSNTGDSILLACQRQQAVLYNLKGEKLTEFSHPKMLAVQSVAFSPNGRYILVGSNSMAGVRNPSDNSLFQPPDDQVRIWELATGKNRSFGDHKSMVLAVDFSPDGTRFLSASKDSTLLIRDLNGNILYQKKWSNMYVATATFSPDGTKILYGGNDLGIWDFVKDSIQHIAPASSPTAIWDVEYSPDGQQIMAAGARNMAYIWNQDGELVQEFRGHSLPFQAAQFSSDGEQILTGSVEPKLWNLDEPLVRRLPGMDKWIVDLTFSPNGEEVLAGGYNQFASLWDRAGNPIQVFKGDTSWVSSVDISKDGQTILTACEDGTASLWRRAGSKLCKIELKEKRTETYYARNHIYEAAIAPDGQHFIVADWEMDVAKLYDRSGNHLKEFPVKGTLNVMEEIHFSPDGSMFALGERKGRISFFRMPGKKIRSFEIDVSWLTCMAFSEDWERIVVGTAEGTVFLLDGKGKELLKFQGHRNMIRTVDISPDGRFILSGGDDHQLKIWNMEGEEVASLISLSEGDWVVMAPSGLFDASPSAMEKMHFNQGVNIIELEQLKERYYEPGLLSKLLGYSNQPVRDVAVFQELALYPEVQLTEKDDQLKIQLTERSGGIGKVSIFINQKEVITDANPDRKTEINVNLRQFLSYYKPKENKISVRVYNAEGWLKSEEIELSYKPGFARIATHQTSLYAVAIGTSDYNGDNLDLQFASDDAQAMATAISSAGSQLFGDRVHTYLLTTESGPDSFPSKTNIQTTLKEIANKAFPQDILLLFMSGHGVTYGSAEKANFYYLTKDIASEDLSDSEIRKNYAISDDELTAWINQITALKQVMIVDACNSGKVVENLHTARKAVNSTQVIALDRMKDRTGMFVLAGSAPDKSSFEATEFGQGLLTYSLLSGMKGGIIQQNEAVDVMKLFQFSRDEVPKLAKRVNGINDTQTPMMAFPSGGASFDIGIITSEVDVPIGKVIPRMLPSIFLDSEQIDDWLDLSGQLNQILQGYTRKKGKGKLMYAPSMNRDPNAYTVRGLYKIDGEELTIQIRLRKGQELIHRFELSGTEEEAPKLVRKMMGEVVKHIK